jgi:hypothetical protein
LGSFLFFVIVLSRLRHDQSSLMQIKDLRTEMRVKTEELRRQDEKCKNLLKEKQLLEQKIARLERNKTDEVK